MFSAHEFVGGAISSGNSSRVGLEISMGLEFFQGNITPKAPTFYCLETIWPLSGCVLVSREEEHQRSSSFPYFNGWPLHALFYNPE